MISTKREYFRINIRKQANNEMLQNKRKGFLNQVIQEIDNEMLELIESLQKDQYNLLQDRNLVLTLNKLFNDLKFMNPSVIKLMVSIMSQYIQYEVQIRNEPSKIDKNICNMFFDMLTYFYMVKRYQNVSPLIREGQFLSQLISIMTDTRHGFICNNIFKIFQYIYEEEDEDIIQKLNQHNMIHIILNQIMQFSFREKHYIEFVLNGLDLIEVILYIRDKSSKEEIQVINSAFWQIVNSNQYKGSIEISAAFIRIFNLIVNLKQTDRNNYHYIFILYQEDREKKFQAQHQDKSIISWIIEQMFHCIDNNDVVHQFRKGVHQMLMGLTYLNKGEYIYYLLQYGITSCLLSDIKTNDQEMLNMICCTLSNIVCENQKTKNEIAKIQIFHYLYYSLEGNPNITNLDNVSDFISDSLESQDNNYFNMLIDQEIYNLILMCLNYFKTKTDCSNRLNNLLQGITSIYRTQITHIQDQQICQQEIRIHQRDYILNFFRQQPQLENQIQETIFNLDDPANPQLTFDNLISLINSDECLKYDQLLDMQ